MVSFQSQLYAHQVTKVRVAVCMMAAFLLAASSTESFAQGTYELQSVNQDGVKVRLEVNTLPATEPEHVSLTFLDPLNQEAIFPARVTDLLNDALIDEGGGLVADNGRGGINEIIYDFPDEVVPPYWNGLPRGSIETGGGPNTTRNVWVGGVASDVDLGQWRLVPEPSTHVLAMTSILSLAGVRKRRRRICR